MYEHDVVEHLLLYCSTASTVEHSAINLHEAAKQVRADKSASASKQTDSIYVLYCSSSTSSTAQHSAISPHKAAKQERVDQRATAQPSRQRASTVLQYRKHSAISLHKAAKQIRANQSATTQASKQTVLASASACRRAFTQHAEFSKRT